MVQFPIPQTIKTDFLSQFSLKEGSYLICLPKKSDREGEIEGDTEREK